MTETNRQRVAVYAMLAAIVTLATATATEARRARTAQREERSEQHHATGVHATAPATTRALIYRRRSQRFARNNEAA